MKRPVRARAAVAASVVATALVLAACGENGSSNNAEDSASDADQSAEDWEPEFVDGQLQPLPDGFPSMPITLLNPAEPDNDDGIYLRHMQEALADISPVDVRVLDRPDFGSTFGAWSALVWQAEQRGGKEGHIMQVVEMPGSTVDLLSTPVAKEVGAAVEKMNTVALTESAPYIVISRKGAPWGDDFKAMLQWAKDNPGKLRYVSRGPGAGPDMAFRQYMDNMGVEANISIGGSHSEQNTVIGAGAGDVAVTHAAAVTPFLERVEVLACTTTETDCKGPWGQAPTAASALGLESDMFGVNRGLVVPPEVSELHRRWLFELVSAVVKDEGYLKSRGQVPSLRQDLRGHDDAVALMEESLKASRPILEKLDLIHPTVE